jgi:hypothetical protein
MARKRFACSSAAIEQANLFRALGAPAGKK